MKTHQKFTLYTLSVLSLILVLLSGCKKEDEPAPQLPPESSFLMNFDDFSNPDDTLASRDMASYQNWGHAYADVAVWNAFISIGLAVPVASFLESFNHEAVYHPDESNWTWSYNVSLPGQTYEAELTGYLQADSVVWEMRITKNNEYSDFLWYHGKSHIDRTGGYWILYANPSNPQPLIKIDWMQDFGGQASIRYTNITPNGPENGGYIYYGTFQGTFDRFYNIYNKGQNNLAEIEWNHTDLHGHVKDPGFYQDYEWHCWGVDLQDVICP